ncbi:MAG: VOC family protein [Chloroflexi bacterium]|nr:VOC family protein [Chloroflexota bacterium]
MEIERVANIIRAVSDLDKSIHFYCDILGMKLERVIDTEDNPASQEFHRKLYNTTAHIRYRDAFVTAADGALVIELVQYMVPAARPMPPEVKFTDAGVTRFTLRVKDIKAAYEELSAKGVRFQGPPALRPAGGGNVLCYDPDGNIVGLTQPQPQ